MELHGSGAIIASMTRLFLLFLVALLPLRSWSIEGMAVAMAAGQTQQVPGEVAGMSAECALQMQMQKLVQVQKQKQSVLAGAQSAEHPTDHQPDHKTCQTCQLCMPLAAAQAPVTLAALSAPRCLPTMASPSFASADPARHAKPPIS